ncbi:N-acetylglucosamine-6-sulfatase-like [Hylaeus volcanicus]|uniref:N-acetylglucosamine-6-sulfatase-like n=1 Tax=Hylaeus volcanicus TaxID=313075 RepID=UPI0023B8418E|nr:N-acetylglucosamine-6-sulfatase-like [Hylaeus volcanicus]XP_053976453.1 N-acetylglucosamine-6-sulfatase-like [Hylaeus volcanicus]XP_053976455.1 N-acetylglucosamine-6-sulfatase-like [Hylaeus volcanicus]XP_053976456.1 N-acetylglucosamine-6-sulfatase-like [Hylaeus volcanicus]
MIIGIFCIFLYYLSLSCSAENIVLIVADDLDVFLDGMTPLTNTLNLIGNQGATFSNCFVASPICCPNRASILTGRYQHNHLVVNNSIDGGCNSVTWQDLQEPNTFAAYLKREMLYTTFYAGKYLNRYGDKIVGGPEHVPTGWDWWAGLIGNSKYYDYSLSINGTKMKFGNNPAEYLTDVISGLAIDFIKTRNLDGPPFLMVLAPPAPHAPFIPAVRHNDKYKGTKAKRTPNFNTPRQTDKHWLARRGPSPLPAHVLPELDEIYRRRWETLLAVDELVTNVYETLKTRDLLNNTYIIFTSDNGYHIGQFSMPMDKRQPYESDIRVPLLIKGPGIVSSKVSAPVSSVDLFATILEIAGVERPSDGTSLLKKTLPKDRTLLIEYRGEKSNGVPSSGCPSDSDPNLAMCMKDMACKCQDAGNNTFSCIRHLSPDYNNIFCVFEDDQHFVEAYNITTDSYQMENIGYSMNRRRRYRFRKHLKKMSVCMNEECIATNNENFFM